MLEQVFNKGHTIRNGAEWQVIGSTARTAADDKFTNAECVNVPTVFRALDIRASGIAKMPIRVYARAGDGKIEVNDEVSYLLNTRPNPNMTPLQFKKLISINVDIYGDAFVWIQTQRGTPVALWVLDNESCALDSVRGQLWLKFKLNETEKRVKYEQVMHFTDINLCNMQDKTDIKGISKLEVAMQSVGNYKNTNKLLTTYYKKGNLSGGILSTPEQLDNSVKTAIKKAWIDANGGIENSGVVVADGGLQWTDTSLNFKDMCIVELSKLTTEELSRVFGVPLHMLSNLDKSSFSNIQQQSLDFYQNTLMPVVVGWEEEMSYKLYTRDQSIKHGYKCKFDYRVAMRADDQSRASYYKTMVEMGVYSINDVLELEDMNKIEHGDTHRVSLNYVDVSMVDQYQQNKSAGGETIE